MAEYRRFVAYVYEYQKEKKGSNCGFVKIEVRGEICRIELHLQCPGLMPESTCSVYGFVRNRGLLDGILLGGCVTGEGKVECILEISAGNMGDSGKSLDEMGGMIFVTEQGGFFGTEWDDQMIRPGNFRVVEKRMIPETQPDLSETERSSEEEIADGVKYIYTDVYGLEGTDTFKVYLPGAPVRDLSEDVYFWVRWANDDSEEGTQDTLTIPIIVNEEMGYGIYSYERQTPYEEAQSTLNTYQASYDAAEEELKKATLQSRMDDYAMQMYDISDSCLNEIWNLVKYNTSEEKFNEILTEQRKWIADKEAAGNEILDQNDGSSAQMDSSLKMAELTMERCEELADYLK